jgi:uncharacterized membrane protein
MREHSRLVKAVLAAGAVGAAVNGGVFFAFSSFVMPGLDRLAPADAVAAMQAVNVTATDPPFMAALFGTTAAMAGLAVAGLRRRHSLDGKLLAAGAGTFLLGVTALTIGYHVPLNDTLAAFRPGDDAAAAWSAYHPGWTGMNHVRAAAGILAAALLGTSAWASTHRGTTTPPIGTPRGTRIT